MGSLKNIENSCHPLSESNNADRCLVVSQQLEMLQNKKGQYDME